jgi:hypothetical protein
MLTDSLDELRSPTSKHQTKRESLIGRGASRPLSLLPLHRQCSPRGGALGVPAAAAKSGGVPGVISVTRDYRGQAANAFVRRVFRAITRVGVTLTGNTRRRWKPPAGMPDGRPSKAGPKPKAKQAKARVSNGRDILPGIDGRSIQAREAVELRHDDRSP